MRIPMKAIRYVFALVIVVGVYGCAAPEQLPEQAALTAQEAIDANTPIVFPPDVDSLDCTHGSGEYLDTATIGPDGGELETKEHKLVIPKDALDKDILFRMRDLKAPSGKVVITPNVTFLNNKTAALTAGYGHCTYEEGKTLDLYRGNVGEANRLYGNDDANAEAITAQIDHLSTYVIGAM